MPSTGYMPHGKRWKPLQFKGALRFDPVKWAETSVAESELESDNDADDSEDVVPLKVLKLSKELFEYLTDIDAELQRRDDNDINFDMPANELLEL